MRPLTVFTPTWNRAHLLPRLYESLLAQDSDDFEWLVVDDGSTDGTAPLVESWQREARLPIRLLRKPNGGMHTAHNAAHAAIETELCVCIDSDDAMAPGAVRTILESWAPHRGDPVVAGLVGLDVDRDGRVVGTALPEGVRLATLSELYDRLGVRGDKKIVLRTDVVRAHPPYPVFDGERLVPLGTLYRRIDRSHVLACVNRPFCVVEYLEDGSSSRIFRQYAESPRGFRWARRLELSLDPPSSRRVRSILHLVSSTLFVGDGRFLAENPDRLLTILLMPAGLLFHAWVRLRGRLGAVRPHRAEPAERRPA
jgi:glycosyltransferase involved in cell wall biosynthesis